MLTWHIAMDMKLVHIQKYLKRKYSKATENP
jgi:hypothetical protein